MKIVILFLLICFTQTANAFFSSNEPIRVEVSGSNHQHAKQNAFRKAVEQKLGAVVLSERESQNSQLARNEVLVYSAGYVDKFSIVSEWYDNGRVRMVVDVWVAESKLADRLLSNPNSIKPFDGGRHSTQYDSYMDERKRGDSMTKMVMDDYPYRAFDIKQAPYQLKLDPRRNLVLIVPFELKWNPNFISSFNEMLSTLEEKKWYNPSRSSGTVTVMAKSPTDYVLGSKNNYRFNDSTRVELLKQAMTGRNEIRLLLRISSLNSNRSFVHCYYPDFVTGKGKVFYKLGDPGHILISGNDVEKNSVSISFPYSPELASQLEGTLEIELRVVAEKDCN